MATMNEMVENFQCPGCMLGSDTKCGKFKDEGKGCESHTPSTRFLGMDVMIALGLPKGFNRVRELNDGHEGWKHKVQLFPAGEALNYDHLNVPVWAITEDGFTFVRVYLPRLDLPLLPSVTGVTFRNRLRVIESA